MKKVKLNTLNPLEKNPFKPKDLEFEKLQKSIKSFEKMMYIRPIVIDEENNILGGNKRFFALKKLGYKEIPENWLHKEAGLTDDEKREFIVKDNIGFGEWDLEILDEWDIDCEEWGLELSLEQQQNKAINTVNGEDSEWVGMPEFDVKVKELSISIKFETEDEREEFCKLYKLKIREKASLFTWSTWWPYKDKDDRNSLKYE